ncbi:monocarboxylate transporter 13, partial [Biomphalaria glabrata]
MSQAARSRRQATEMTTENLDKMADQDKALLKVPNGVNGSIRVDKNANGVDVKVQPKREDNPYGIPIDRGWAWVIVV